MCNISPLLDIVNSAGVVMSLTQSCCREFSCPLSDSVARMQPGALSDAGRVLARSSVLPMMATDSDGIAGVGSTAQNVPVMLEVVYPLGCESVPHISVMPQPGTITSDSLPMGSLPCGENVVRH
jgi:hypothetical protein